MAQLLQLDAAATLVGKSEVTLRRLIKSGKIPVHKEKTLTGFIYLVDAEHVKAYYQGRGETHFVEREAEVVPKAQEPATSPAQGRRLAVADETGDVTIYWQKRAETYEERYHQEVQKHSNAREELGVWRGRAEQAQAMLMKMLPAAPEVISQPAQAALPHSVKNSQGDNNGASSFFVVAVTVALLLLSAAIVYVVLNK